jgi:acyl carrier protein
VDAAALLRQFIEKTILSGWGSLGNDTPLLTSGLVDSIGKMRLVLFIEKTFKIEIRAEEVASGGLETISAIVRLVQSKTQSNTKT